MLLSSSVLHYFGRLCDTLLPHHFTLPINVTVLVSFTGQKDSITGDAYLQGLTKRPDRSETIKMQVSLKIDFTEFPVVINLLRY